MEEYFPPLGTDHQILEGQEARFPFSRLALILGGVLFVLLLASIGFFVWQKRVTFHLPDTQVSVTLDAEAQTTLLRDPSIVLPEAWRSILPSSASTLVLGGDVTQPTWLLAPVWVRLPSSFTTIERHGLYRLSQKDGANTEKTFSASRHEIAHWTDTLEPSLGAFRLNDPSFVQEPVFFAWNSHWLKSSLPFTAQGDLSASDDVSYALQQNSFDQTFLQTIVFHGQGLSTLRKDLRRVSWTGPLEDRSWEFVLRDPSSSTASLLLEAASGTRTETHLLRDGSAITLYKGQAPSSTLGSYRVGSVPPPSSLVCHASDAFHPFLRIRGSALQHDLHLPFFATTTLTVFEVGSLDGFLSICLR